MSIFYIQILQFASGQRQLEIRLGGQGKASASSVAPDSLCIYAIRLTGSQGDRNPRSSVNRGIASKTLINNICLRGT